MLIQRAIEAELHQLLKEYPVVTILGPRQSGKTTLTKMALKGYAYANLEDPATREIAREDPVAFLSRYNDRVVVDEVGRYRI
jgi:predicted AAA+ superfamily ATPase